MRVLVTAAILLVLGTATALAASAKFSYSPDKPVAGEPVTFTADDDCTEDTSCFWSINGSLAGEGKEMTHTFAEAGDYQVGLAVVEGDEVNSEEKTVTVAAPAPDPEPENRRPTAGFTTATDGLVATFTSTSTDPDGDELTHRWEFGDGKTSSSTNPSHTYEEAGTYTVRLTVTDGNGGRSTASQTIRVEPATTTSTETTPPPPAPEPPPATPPTTGTPPAPAPVATAARLSPFPIVRIAGDLSGNRTIVRIFSVRGPNGATVEVRCQGRSCPVKMQKRTIRTRSVRLRRFEDHRLRAGTRLEIRVTKAGFIGKVTRLRMRAGRSPRRDDLCLAPGATAPTRCTSS